MSEKKPSAEWLKQMADKEDQCESIAAGAVLKQEKIEAIQEAVLMDQAVVFHEGEGNYSLLRAGKPGSICEGIGSAEEARLLCHLWNMERWRVVHGEKPIMQAIDESKAR